MPRILLIVGAAIGLIAPFVMMVVDKFTMYSGWYLFVGSPIVNLGPMFFDLGPVGLYVSATGVLVLGGFAAVGLLAFLRLRAAPILASVLGAVLLVGAMSGVRVIHILPMSILEVLARWLVPAILLLAGGIAGLLSRNRSIGPAGAAAPSGGAPMSMAAPVMGGSQIVVQPGGAGPTDGMAIASCVLSLLGLLVCGLLSVIGVVLAHVSFARIKRTHGVGGRGLALAGIILGWVAIVLWIAAVIVLVALGSSARY